MAKSAEKGIPESSSDAIHGEYHVLVEFAVRHLDFQLAELESVLDMHGIQLVSGEEEVQSSSSSSSRSSRKERQDSKWKASRRRRTCRIVPLAQTLYDPSDSPPPVTSNPKRSARRPFVLLSLPFDSPFVPLSARARTGTGTRNDGDHSTTNIEKDDDPPVDDKDIASILLSRCILVRSVLELWGMSTSLEDCATQAQQWVSTNAVGRTVYQQTASDVEQSWKLTIHTLGSKFSRQEHEDMRSLFSGLNLAGPVQMKDPTNEFVLIREVELDAAGGALYPRHGQRDRVVIAAHDARPPLACYFGRALGGCRSIRRMGGKMQDYSLKARKYLGPTSMDAELSFVMTNLGQVKTGGISFDPFVGTGSILLSCALRGAHCIGTDIDIRILRGRNDDENVLTNFRQFGLPRPELVRSDNGIYHRHFRLGEKPLYDSILCDPPYGIRAGARKSGSRRDVVVAVKPENRHDHIAQTQPYAVSDVMADLMDVAARTLVTAGRLVYVIPSFADDFDPDADLPQHPCLQLVHVCYQPLSAELGRRMVVMKKVAEYVPAKRMDYLSAVWKNGSESAEKCANIREKIMEAAKKKPRYEERALIRKEKRKVHKEEKKLAKKRARANEE